MKDVCMPGFHCWIFYSRPISLRWPRSACQRDHFCWATSPRWQFDPYEVHMKQPTSMYPDVCCVLCTSFQQNCHVTGDASFNVAVAQEWKSDGQVVWPHCGNFAPLTETRELKRFRSHTWRRPVVQRARRPRIFLRCGTCTPTIYNWIAASGRSSWSTTGLCYRSTASDVVGFADDCRASWARRSDQIRSGRISGGPSADPILDLTGLIRELPKRTIVAMCGATGSRRTTVHLPSDQGEDSIL